MDDKNQSTPETSFIGYHQVLGTATTNNSDWNFEIKANSMQIPIFIIGQPIYHITPESTKGYIIDIRYNYKDNSHEYLVTWGPTSDGWYYDTELSLELQF